MPRENAKPQLMQVLVDEFRAQGTDFSDDAMRLLLKTKYPAHKLPPGNPGWLFNHARELAAEKTGQALRTGEARRQLGK
jgi:hypothetical protein